MAGANDTRQNGGRPAWQRLTKRQLKAAVELAREGLNRQQISEKLKLPKGALRARLRFDPLFEADFERAKQEGNQPKADQLLERMWEIAYSDNRSALRACHFLLMVYSADYRAAHSRQRVELTGKDGGPLEHKLFDPTKLTDEDLDALDQLLAKATTGE